MAGGTNAAAAKARATGAPGTAGLYRRPRSSLSDVELLPRNTEPMAPVPAVGLTATAPLAAPSNRRGWLLGRRGRAWPLSRRRRLADIAGVVDLGVAAVLGLRFGTLRRAGDAGLPTTAPSPQHRGATKHSGPVRRSPVPRRATAAPVETPTASATPSLPAEPPAATVEAASAAPAEARGAARRHRRYRPAPAPPEPAKPEPAKPADTPAVQMETVEKDAATAAPDTPVSRTRREVGRLLLRAEAAENARNTE